MNDHDNDFTIYGARKTDNGYWLLAFIVVVLLFVAAVLVTPLILRPAEAAPLQQNTVTDIQPSKKNLGCSISEAVANDGICISKELTIK